MSRGSSDSARRAGLLAVAIGLAAAIAAAGARLRRDASARRSDPAAYRCGCGKAYRVSGTDRHRVYWPADAPDSAPVLGNRCVQCDAALPAGHEAPPAPAVL
jgi:hypothetical protein